MPALSRGSLRRESSSSLRRNSFDEQRTKKILDPNAPIRIKILSLGSQYVGKSCIIKRYCEGRFVSKYIATVGVDYGVKPIVLDHGSQSNTVRVNFWDLSGRAEFLEIRNEFYRDTQGCMLVYDVADRVSFQDLPKWLDEATQYGMSRDLPVVVCANKIDKIRRVSEEEGRIWAESRGFAYFETSACSGASIDELFQFLFKALIIQIVVNFDRGRSGVGVEKLLRNEYRSHLLSFLPSNHPSEHDFISCAKIEVKTLVFEFIKVDIPIFLLKIKKKKKTTGSKTGKLNSTESY